jgi:hypothetical protein
MSDLIVAVGLVLVLEGLIWSIAPHFGQRMLEAAAEAGETTLRLSGTLCVAAGVFLVWLVRG